MASLSISKAWDEGAGFAARELRLLFPIAFLLLALPPILTELILPMPAGYDSVDLTREMPWQRPGYGLYMGLSLLFALINIVLSTLGTLAISYLALRPGTSVGESFRVALQRLLPTVLALLIIGVAAIVVILALSLLFGASILSIVAQGGAPGPGAAAGIIGTALLLLLVVGIGFLAIGAKLAPMMAVAVIEPRGPGGIIGRSWQLTSGHFWKLLGTLLLLFLVYLMAVSAIGLVLGGLVWAVVGNPVTSPTAAFVLALLFAVLSAIISPFIYSFLARIYAQLSGQVATVGEVFS